MQAKPATDIGRALKLFSEQNLNRPTRIAVFQRADGLEDYWLEDGLPLLGVDLDAKDPGCPELEISLGSMGDGGWLTHCVKDVAAIKLTLSMNGVGNSLEVQTREDETTLMEFEDWPN